MSDNVMRIIVVVFLILDLIINTWAVVQIKKFTKDREGKK